MPHLLIKNLELGLENPCVRIIVTCYGVEKNDIQIRPASALLYNICQFRFALSDRVELGLGKC